MTISTETFIVGKLKLDQVEVDLQRAIASRKCSKINRELYHTPNFSLTKYAMQLQPVRVLRSSTISCCNRVPSQHPCSRCVLGCRRR
jgi:hypothetical protein